MAIISLTRFTVNDPIRRLAASKHRDVMVQQQAVPMAASSPACEMIMVRRLTFKDRQDPCPVPVLKNIHEMI